MEKRTSRIAPVVITLVGVSVACSKSPANVPTPTSMVRGGASSPRSANPRSESSASSPANQSAAPSATDKVARDPLLGDSVAADCGPPRDNPHGYEWGVEIADGSCQSCEQPPLTLPTCNAAIQALDVVPGTLKANVGKRIRLNGVVEFSAVHCTMRGGRCACTNPCSARLRLRHRSTPVVPIASKQERINQRNAILNGTYSEPREPQANDGAELSASYVLLAFGGIGADAVSSGLLRKYTTDAGVFTCIGDDVSLCCPFALDRETQKLRVIAGGLLLAGSPQEYRLHLQDICRIAD